MRTLSIVAGKAAAQLVETLSRTVMPDMLHKRQAALLVIAGVVWLSQPLAAQRDTVRASTCPSAALNAMTEPDTSAAWLRVMENWARQTPGTWSNDSLRRVLRTLAERDQAVRRGITADSVKDSSFIRRMTVADSANSVAMRSIMDRYGWPGKSMVGVQGASDAFLIVQHSDALRPEALRLMQAAGPGEVMPADLALVVDRQRTTAGRPQVYGSQLDTLTNGVLPFFPIENPEDVEQRRARAGLPPLLAYACTIAAMYHAPVVLPAGVRR